jgi:hypothetical protein
VDRNHIPPPAVYGIKSQEMENPYEALYALMMDLLLTAYYLSIREIVQVWFVLLRAHSPTVDLW